MQWNHYYLQKPSISLDLDLKKKKGKGDFKKGILTTWFNNLQFHNKYWLFANKSHVLYLPSACIQLPRVTSDLLILAPSCNLSLLELIDARSLKEVEEME